MSPEPERWNKFARWLKSPAAYRVLDASAAAGGTWTAGGCGILAYAIHEVLHLPVVCIYEHEGLPEHLVIRVAKDIYFDADGLSSREKLLRRWQELEGLRRPRLSRFSRKKIEANGIECRDTQRLHQPINRILLKSPK